MDGAQSQNLWQLVALTGLICKLIFLWWARPQKANFAIGRIHLRVLTAFILANTIEFISYYDPSYILRGSYVTYFIAIVTLVHLVLVAGFDIQRFQQYRLFTTILYGLTTAMVAIIIFTDKVVSGFRYTPEITIGVPYTGAHGPWYMLYMYILILGITILILALVRGSFRENTPRKRMRCRWLLFALTPLVLAAFAVIAKLLNFYTAPFNATVIMPLASTLFLAVTVYATHQHQLFGLELPWSLSWWQKTPYYRRLYRALDEIARFPNIHGIVERIEDVLNTGVVLLAPNDEIFQSKTATLTKMRDVPRAFLENVNRTVVTEELQESDPSLYQALSSHAISAAIAFYPHHSRSHDVKASGWLLLGQGFGNKSYNLPEKRALEELIASVAELHDDRIVSLQREIEVQKNAIKKLQQQIPELQSRQNTSFDSPVNRVDIGKIHKPAQETADEILKTVSEEILSGLGENQPKILVFSRDSSFIEKLQKDFPQLDDYVAPYWYVLTKQAIPSVVIYDRREASAADDGRLFEWLTPAKHSVAVFVLGAQGLTWDIDKHASIVLHNFSDFPAVEELAHQIHAALPQQADTPPALETLDNYVAILETKIIKKTLDITQWDRRKAARLLSVSPNTLYKKIRQYGILREEGSQEVSSTTDDDKK